MSSQEYENIVEKAQPQEDKGSTPEAHAVWYRKMHETQPVRYVKEYDYWDVFSYKDVRHVLTEHTLFSARRTSEGFPEAVATFNTDPPDHRRYRNTITKTFMHRMQQLVPYITSTVDSVLERNSASGKIDIVEQLAYPLPIRVMAELVGVPVEDREHFVRLAYQFLELLPHPDDPDHTELMQYFSDMIAQRMDQPRDDLMSDLLIADVDGEPLTRDEVFTLCVGLLIASMTTPMLLSFTTRRFIKDPRLFQDLRRDPSLIPGAIEEILRFEFTQGNVIRIARQDTTLGGHEIKKGQLILAWMGAANFDEAYFPHAEQFDIQRSPNPHLTFGYGIHYCMGAPLARLEGKILIERMLAHWLDIQSDPENPPKYVNTQWIEKQADTGRAIDRQIDLLLSFPIRFTLVKNA